MADDLPGGDINASPEDDSVRAELEAAWNAAEAGGEDGGGDKTAPDADPARAAADAEAIARDERGRFAKKEAEDKAAAETAAAGAPGNGSGGGGAPDPAAAAAGQAPDPAAASAPEANRPPPGWSVASKAAWDQLPDHIRADIAKRETEISDGFAQYSGVKPYVEMARSSGTTLPEALERYTGMENLLRKDFRSGIFAIAQNMGVTPQQFQQMFGGAAPAGQQPNQNGQQQNGAANPALGDLDDPYVKAAVEAALKPVTQQLTQFQTTLQQRQQADQNREIASAEKVVNEFRASAERRYFSDVEPIINDLIDKRMIAFTGDYRTDLATAYDMACQLHPEVREALINERISKTEAEKQAAAAKAEQDKRAKADAARKASISVRGAPSGTVSAPNGSKGSVREDLIAAWDEHV